MGLDISFNREQAIAAGLKLRKSAGLSWEEARERAKDGNGVDLDYAKYLTQDREYVEVPDRDFLVENDGISSIVVRANKWGRTYEPLTQWLKANNIQWSEF